MKIDTIYVDMDDVLVDIQSTLCLMESPFAIFTIKDIPVPEKWKDNPIVYLIRKHINRHPFIWAKPTPEFHELHALMRKWKKDGYKVEILSSGTKDPRYFTKVIKQKKIWLERYLPGFNYHFAQGSSTKKRWAKPNCLLIDDHDKNVIEWREAGGLAFHFKIDYNKDTYITGPNLITTLKHLEVLGI